MVLVGVQIWDVNGKARTIADQTPIPGNSRDYPVRSHFTNAVIVSIGNI
jgi:hypothetical protein